MIESPPWWHTIRTFVYNENDIDRKSNKGDVHIIDHNAGLSTEWLYVSLETSPKMSENTTGEGVEAVKG